ncbi:MAG: methyl-accepting chemotaxis protein [Actinobacteria bacterium]|nr:methyl-accepting chemotaxis protein [Actinomycetota bacterium]
MNGSTSTARDATRSPDAVVPRRRGVTAWFSDRTIRTKILSLVGALAIVAGYTGWLAVTSLHEVSSDATSIDNAQRTVAVPLAVVHQEEIKARMLVAQAGAYPTDTGDEQQVFRDKIAATDADLKTAADAVDAGIAGTEVPPWTAFKTDWAAWIAIRDAQLLPAAFADDGAAFAQVSGTIAQPVLDKAIADLEATESAMAASLDQVATEAAGEAASAIRTVTVTLIAGVLLVVLLGLWTARLIRRQIVGVQHALDALASGDLTVAADVASTDEMGHMARSLNLAQTSLREALQEVATTAATVDAAAEQLAASNSQVAAGSDETSAQAGVVAAAAEQVSRNVQTVAAGAEEMGASIREISQNANQAARVASQATGVAATTNDTIAKLGISSAEIGNVVKAITSIAEQTNLLALNATIEAARAGEAGKGFAVVAGEVKDLAQETARATEDIARRVEAIQADTTGAVQAIEEIAGIIATINDYQLTIASAVEEQTATTNEMSRSVQEAATGSVEIATNITGVARSASTTTEVLGQVSQSVAELAQLSAALRTKISAFTF